LIQLAEAHAKKVGRKIAEIDEDKIRVDSGRNIVIGVTTCSAVYKVEWLQSRAGK
jgi:hypothetical protein